MNKGDEQLAKVNTPPSAMNLEGWGWASIGVNIILILINWVVSRASHSLAVEAELVHNVVDLFTAFGVLVGLKIAMRKSLRFPYGMYKIENVISVILALMTFVTAYEIAMDAILHQIVIATVNLWMLGGVVIAFSIPLVFSYFELKVGKIANSPALIADAREYQTHVFTTGVVLAALVGQWLKFPLDRIAALVIVVAISKTGWALLSDGMRVLLDASLDAESLALIRNIVESEPAVINVKWITGRNAGRFRFVEAAVTLRVNALEKADTITHRMTDQIRKEVPHVDRALIHAESADRIHWRYAIPLADVNGVISEHFGEAPFYAIHQVRTRDGIVEIQQIIANAFLQNEKAKGIRVAEWLVEQKVDVVVLLKGLDGKGPVYVFADAGVDVRIVDVKDMAQAIAIQIKRDMDLGV